MNPRRAAWAAGCAGAFVCFSAVAQVNILTYHDSTSRTGANSEETILRPSNVNSTTFGKLFSYNVDGYVYAQPLYVSGLTMPGKGTHNVLFIATEHNTVYAFDADSSTGIGGLLWQTNLGPSAATPNSDFGNRYGPYHDINPEVGITGTPVIDQDSGTLYVDAFTHDGSSYHHRLHALNILDGTERPDSPVLVSASVSGTGIDSAGGQVVFNPEQQLQRSALTLAGGIVYVCYAGYADTDPYHGWVIGFSRTNLQQLTNYVFNTTPNSTSGANPGEAGIWMAGGGPAVDAGTNLYFETGNGSFNAYLSGGTEYGDTFVKLATGAGLVVADYFTPYNQANMEATDLDLGSGGLILLPDQPGPNPHLLIGAGKEGKIYLVNRDQMTSNNGHYNSTGSVDYVVQTISGQLGGGSFGTPAYFNGRVYYAASGTRLKAFSLTGGLLSTTPVSTGSRTYGFPGATPSVSANGTNNGIVWALQNANPAVLAAYNANNLTTELYNSSQAAGNRDQLAAAVKFTVPTIANGKVYAGGQYSVAVLGLLDPLLNWKYAHFGSNATNAAVAGDLADPDGDRAVNLLEYALATDPNTPNPTGSLTGSVVGDQFQVHFHRNTSASDLTYIMQQADTLAGTWTDLMTYTAAAGWVANTAGAAAAESVPSNTPPDQFVDVTITDPTMVAGAGNRFLRLLVHR